MEKRIINLGRIHEQKVQIITQTFTKAITNVKCGCSCSVHKFQKLSKEVTVKFTPNKVTTQAKRAGKDSYNTSKSCTITFDDKTTLNLQWNAEVYSLTDRNGKPLT